jgi:phosphatidate phosphatase APP1
MIEQVPHPRREPARFPIIPFAMNEANLFSRFLHRMALELEGDIERLRGTLGDGRRDKRVRLLPFAGYRNATELRVKGRVVRYAEPLSSDGGMLSNIRAMWAIYNSHEVAGVPVVCRAAAAEHSTLSDEEGYFEFHLPTDAPLPTSTRWETVTLMTPGWQMQESALEVPILAPGTDEHWAIISDIDDTIIETGATNFLKNWRRVLAERPEDRLAVPGASSLYGIIAGDHAAPTRPFFYVSSSPWNLYGFLTEFMEFNRIPHGPMFLKDLGLDANKFIHTGHESHKLAAIRNILAFYPGHKFLLIGDNGQKDVEIYAEAVQSFPERVAAVFIRDVSVACAHGAKAELIAQMAREGVATYCAADLSGGVAILKSLGLERVIEVAKAAGQAPSSRG